MKQDPNSITKKELIEFLKENLALDIKEESDYSGSYKYVDIKLRLCEEVISTISFSIP